MEILAPAGSKEQVVNAITAGCDAVYGGFGQWNARNRAINFTIKEYNETLEICHEHGVRFYLTLNTLLRNEEIKEILALLSSNEVALPDAFIVCDLGLMMLLMDEFSDIPVHASTQFGASNIEDVKFLQSIGISRVILARELSINEIEYICANCDIEVEVFIYGSQCVCFSGQCLFGGLLHGNSGNRGRCIGMCRDIYSTVKGGMGQYLYPHDLNAVELKRRLADIGVCSVKIEGRMRASQEICKVIRSIKGNNYDNIIYDGFLLGENPVSGMFQSLNSRVKTRNVDLELLSKDDLVLYEGKIVHFNDNNNNHESVDFIKSSRCSEFDRASVNVSIKLINEGLSLVGLDYINSDGERTKFIFKKNKTDYNRINEIYDLIVSNIVKNVYEVSSEEPSHTVFAYNKGELLDCINDINRDIEKKHDKKIMNENIQCDVIETRNWEKTLEYIDETEYEQVIYDIDDLQELIMLLDALPDDNVKVLFRLPVVDFKGSFIDILNLLIGRRVIVGKPSVLWYIKKEKLVYKEIIADYSMNIWNDLSLSFVEGFGVAGMIIHPELAMSYVNGLACSEGFQKYIFGKTFFDVGYVRGCFGLTDCCEKLECIDNHGFVLRNEQKGFCIKITCNHKTGVKRITPDIVFFSNTNYDGIKRIQDDRTIELYDTENNYMSLYERGVK